jgi:hypothetical protein
MHHDHPCEEATAAPVAASSAATAAPAAPRPAAADQRGERIAEFLRDSLQKRDAFEASIGAAMADLLSIGHRLAAGITAAGDETPVGSEAYEDMSLGIKDLLLVNRQITRYAQLELQWMLAKNATRNGKRPGGRSPG